MLLYLIVTKSGVVSRIFNVTVFVILTRIVNILRVYVIILFQF